MEFFSDYGFFPKGLFAEGKKPASLLRVVTLFFRGC